MANVKAMMCACAVGMAVAAWGMPPADARQGADVLSKDASECEIAAALLGPGARPDCADASAGPEGEGQKGLFIGTAAPEPPPAPPPVPTPEPPRVESPAGSPEPVPEPVPVPVPAPAPAPVSEPAAVTAGRAAFQINFEFGSTTLTPDSRQTLDRIAGVLKSPAAERNAFRIVGHTDSVGNPQTNLKLSTSRALAVKQYLIKQHKIPASRLQHAGKGSSEPTNPADPTSAVNRRVEIINLGS